MLKMFEKTVNCIDFIFIDTLKIYLKNIVGSTRADLVFWEFYGIRAIDSKSSKITIYKGDDFIVSDKLSDLETYNFEVYLEYSIFTSPQQYITQTIVSHLQVTVLPQSKCSQPVALPSSASKELSISSDSKEHPTSSTSAQSKSIFSYLATILTYLLTTFLIISVFALILTWCFKTKLSQA